MTQMILGFLKGFPHEAIVMILAALPVSELRGAIPLGFYFGFGLYKAFWLAVTGNIIVVIPLLFFLEPVSDVLRKFPLWAKFFDWLFERTKKKAELVQKYEAVGLALFVAVPLPVTGAWTAAVAAALFKIRFRYAFPAIVVGIFIAGVVVSTLCILGMAGYRAACVP